MTIVKKPVPAEAGATSTGRSERLIFVRRERHLAGLDHLCARNEFRVTIFHFGNGCVAIAGD